MEDVVDFEVVYDPAWTEGQPNGLGAIPRPFLTLLSRLGDVLLDGHRGDVLTEGLIAAGFARDPATLRAVSRAYPAALDDYLGAIDLERIASRALDPDEEGVGLLDVLTSPTTLLVGAAGLALGIALAPSLNPHHP